MAKPSEFKLVLLGMSGVGKTSLVSRYMDDTFDISIKSSIGMAFRKKTISVSNTSITLNIWDTAGQERYFSVVSLYYRNCQAAIVVYDITYEKSFVRAQSWVRSLKTLETPPRVIVLAANKTEPLKKSVVDVEVVREYAEQNGLTFTETSCKTALNVKEIFQAVAEQLSREYECNVLSRDNDEIQLDDHKSKKPERKCC